MMRGAIIIKDLAVETNINGNYVLYFQHTHEGHKTPIEIRPIPSLVNQMCVVYDATANKFVPQDLATYVENTPSFKNKIREVAGTATLIAPNGVAVVPTVLVVEDVSYLPLVGNKEGDIAFDAYYDTIYVWEGNAWRNSKPTTVPTVTTAAQPNITSVGTLTGITSNGVVNLTGTSNVSLGSISNLHITGGTSGYFIKTDGTGNLTWASATGSTSDFGTRTYTGTGSQTAFTVTSGVNINSVLVTENGLVQTPTTDYTISGTTLTFVTAPGNGVIIQIRELAVATAASTPSVYRAYTGNGVATTFTVSSDVNANNLIVAENGIIQRPTTDYTVSGSTVTFVTAPNNGVDIQIRELSLNGGSSLPFQSGNSGKYLTTDGATATWATVTSGVTLGKTVALNMFIGF
jgi:hypothetical protein